MAAKTPTPTPAPPPTVGERVKNFLGWAFLLSIAIHFLVLPLVVQYNPSHAEQPETEKVSVTKKTKVVVPTPPPPTPPPTPPPKSTPPPVKATNPPPQAKLKVNIVHTTSKSASGPSEAQYNVKNGSANGVPQGTVASAAPAPEKTTAATAAPPPPTPSPTPRPQCAVPNAPPTTLNAVQVDTPEMAKDQGVTGVVELKVDLDATSHITNVSVQKSPSSLLNQAAIQSARQSTFQTEIVDCKPVANSYIFQVEFTGS